MRFWDEPSTPKQAFEDWSIQIPDIFLAKMRAQSSESWCLSVPKPDLDPKETIRNQPC